MYFANKINRFFRNPGILSIIALSIVIIPSVWFLTPDESDFYVTLNTILEKGEITFITRNNAHCYYIYQDQKMGFEYDLAKEFAAFLGVKLIIKSRYDELGKMIPALKKNKGQVIAASQSASSYKNAGVVLSDGYMTIQQRIIVARDNHNVRKLTDLQNKIIHVKRGTSYYQQLEKLKHDGMDFEIKTVRDIQTEDLIRQVARGEIEITIADSNVAMLNRRYYPQTVVGAPINKKEYLAWAVSPESKGLLKKINQFFKKIKEDGTLDEIYERYYAAVDLFDYVDIRAYHRRLESRLPKYGPIIKAAAEKHGFDWRLIAAQIYQESHFRRWAKSRAGAYGLMQLIRRTARSYGVKNIFDPEQNINAGVRHLKKLYRLFDHAEGADRLFITLAAYNIGQGHVRDAQRLAEHIGLDPNKWSALSQTLPMLEKHKYYQHAKYGYCRGSEPIQYVRQIMIYYDILKYQSLEDTTTIPPGDQVNL